MLSRLTSSLLSFSTDLSAFLLHVCNSYLGYIHVSYIPIFFLFKVGLVGLKFELVQDAYIL